VSDEAYIHDAGNNLYARVGICSGNKRRLEVRQRRREPLVVVKGVL
jgi:hypothetical protein